MRALKSVLAAASAAVVLAPAFAFADGEGGIGDVANTVTGQLDNFVPLIGILCLVVGIAFTGMGILKFRQHAENPNQVPISQPLIRMAIGVLLIALPSTIDMGVSTLFGGDGQTLSADGDGGAAPLGDD